MPGSLGGTDLWKVTVNADGTFGIPKIGIQLIPRG
jgi:hypothetical protein